MGSLAFVDTETTGLDSELHEIWEVGLIVDEKEFVWQLPVDLGRADPVALRIGHFMEPGRRFAESDLTPQRYFAARFAAETRGRHLVGAVVSFDEERLRKLLRANGACPEWHYHLIDVEALAVGYLAGLGVDLSLPWNSDDLTERLGLTIPDESERHTALGDARWAKSIYEVICGSGVNA